MKRRELHVVIGAGVSGCLSAITRSRTGYDVLVLEKERARSAGTYPVCTQTSNIVSENHSGAEYPFDPQSARDCLDGRIENERFFPELIFGGKTFSRIIASQGMVDSGQDIVGQCHKNMEVIRSHYAHLCEEDPAKAVFGEPADICQEISGVEGVNDVASVFVTPQRGINPVMVSTILDWELKATAVDLREGSEVVSVEPQPDGRFLVAFEEEDGTRESVVADQVGICAATAAFAMAKRLNFSIRFPKLFMALRTILYVDLPESTKKNFTCLKLEDSFGGMLSPLSNECAMIYYPPAAHIMTAVMDPQSCEPPTAYARYLLSGHPETEERASRTLERLREFYPELQRSKILGAYVKVAINTVADSRVRRNVGVFAVCPGAVMTVLPKWTMCVVNARAELAMALRHSVSIGNSKPEESRERLAEAEVACWQSPPTWATNPEAITAEAAKHARNMEVPEVLAHRFGVPEESLSLEPA